MSEPATPREVWLLMSDLVLDNRGGARSPRRWG